MCILSFCMWYGPWVWNKDWIELNASFHFNVGIISLPRGFLSCCRVRQNAKHTAVPVGREAQLDPWLLLTVAKLWQVPAHCSPVSDTRCSECILICTCLCICQSLCGSVYIGLPAWKAHLCFNKRKHQKEIAQHPQLTNSSIKPLLKYGQCIVMTLRHPLRSCTAIILHRVAVCP